MSRKPCLFAFQLKVRQDVIAFLEQSCFLKGFIIIQFVFPITSSSWCSVRRLLINYILKETHFRRNWRLSVECRSLFLYRQTWRKKSSHDSLITCLKSLSWILVSIVVSFERNMSWQTGAEDPLNVFWLTFTPSTWSPQCVCFTVWFTWLPRVKCVKKPIPSTTMMISFSKGIWDWFRESWLWKKESFSHAFISLIPHFLWVNFIDCSPW